MIKASGINIHPIACYTGCTDDVVTGTVFDLSREEMLQADAYEADDYTKVRCTLASGNQAWVYIKKA